MNRVLCVSVSAAGAAIAARLPYEHRPGRLVETVRTEWEHVDAFVIVAAMGVATRAVGPLLSDKHSDPAVVCVDDTGRFAVALAGGHASGANALAREVASLLGATPVVTTATDLAGLPALDSLPGFRAAGDLAGLTRRWLDGQRPHLVVDEGLQGWPLPPALLEAIDGGGGDGGGGDGGGGDGGGGDGGGGSETGAAPVGSTLTVTVSDARRDAGAGEVVLRPPSIVVGVGASTGADPAGLWSLLGEALSAVDVHPGSVAAVATLDRKAAEPAIRSLAQRLGVPLVTFSAGALKDVATERGVARPSRVVEEAVGTPSVSEAAALLAAGPDSSLVFYKHVSTSADSTVAIARRRRPPGHLAVVGLGPGDPSQRTPAAAAAVRHAEVVIGYGPYVDLAGDLISAGQLVLRSPIGSEADRCRAALERAAGGQKVALVCSGDAGIYAMASLVCELAPATGDPPVTVVAGVTAALSGAALLGAPLGHDHASISLSDLLTPWDVIVRRLQAAAEADFVVSLYNPRSQRRSTQLREAQAVLSAHRPPSTPAAVLTDIGRRAQSVVRTTLAELDPDDVTMLSLVIVGSSQTRWIGTRMVTPRGYQGLGAE